MLLQVCLLEECACREEEGILMSCASQSIQVLKQNCLARRKGRVRERVIMQLLLSLPFDIYIEVLSVKVDCKSHVHNDHEERRNNILVTRCNNFKHCRSTPTSRRKVKAKVVPVFN
jgi:hypothetical protein